MMNDLDTLRPEVLEAVREIVLVAAGSRPDLQRFIAVIRAELLRLARNDADARIALDADHDWKEMYERAKKAEAELAALRARTEWQPIETCPKDGSLFLIWVHAETHGETDDGLQFVADNSCADLGWWRTGTDPMPYGYVDFASQNTHDVDEPTHWMPLPPPPKGED